MSKSDSKQNVQAALDVAEEMDRAVRAMTRQIEAISDFAEQIRAEANERDEDYSPVNLLMIWQNVQIRTRGFDAFESAVNMACRFAFEAANEQNKAVSA